MASVSVRWIWLRRQWSLERIVAQFHANQGEKVSLWKLDLLSRATASGNMKYQTFKHIFTSPSSVEKEARATRSGNARIHGMTCVTRASIAYIATQVSTLICDTRSDSILSEIFGLRPDLLCPPQRSLIGRIPSQIRSDSIIVYWNCSKTQMKIRKWIHYSPGGTGEFDLYNLLEINDHSSIDMLPSINWSRKARYFQTTLPTLGLFLKTAHWPKSRPNERQRNSLRFWQTPAVVIQTRRHMAHLVPDCIALESIHYDLLSCHEQWYYSLIVTR